MNPGVRHEAPSCRLALLTRGYAALVFSAFMRATMASITADFACSTAAMAKSIAKDASQSMRSAWFSARLTPWSCLN